MQFLEKVFGQFFPDKIVSRTISWFLLKFLTFPWHLSNSPTIPGFPKKWSLKKDLTNTCSLPVWIHTTAFCKREQYNDSDADNNHYSMSGRDALILEFWVRIHVKGQHPRLQT